MLLSGSMIPCSFFSSSSWGFFSYPCPFALPCKFYCQLVKFDEKIYSNFYWNWNEFMDQFWKNCHLCNTKSSLLWKECVLEGPLELSESGPTSRDLTQQKPELMILMLKYLELCVEFSLSAMFHNCQLYI